MADKYTKFLKKLHKKIIKNAEKLDADISTKEMAEIIKTTGKADLSKLSKEAKIEVGKKVNEELNK